MKSYSLGHLSDQAVIQALAALVASDRLTTAALLAHLGEAEARRLHRQSGASSMFEYCVSELGLSEASAYRRIQVARVCRKFPQLHDAIADGRLNLTAVLLLRPHLRAENVEDLIQAAAHRRKAEIEHVIAERYGAELAPELVGQAKFKEIAPGILEMRVMMRTATVAKLRHVQDLMSHRNPSRNMEVVLDRMADLTIAQLEKQKFATTDHPRPARPTAPDSRHIPAEVRRAVYARDGGQCTFIDARGRRCGSRHQLELDHIVPVARGGKSTVENLRLLCRGHNHLAAMSVYGLAFMGHRIDEARAGRAAAEPSRALLPSGFPGTLLASPTRAGAASPRSLASGTPVVSGAPLVSGVAPPARDD
jgi:hypothetical protein